MGGQRRRRRLVPHWSGRRAPRGRSAADRRHGRLASRVARRPPVPAGRRRWRWKAEISGQLAAFAPSRCDFRPFSDDTFNSDVEIADARSAQGFARKRAVSSLWGRTLANSANGEPKDGARRVPKMVAIGRADRPKSVILSAGRVILEKCTPNFARLAKIVTVGLEPSGFRQKLSRSFDCDRVEDSSAAGDRNYKIFPLFQSNLYFLVKMHPGYSPLGP